MAGEDTWENRKNLENAKELVEEFEREHGEEVKELRQQEQEEEKKKFSRELSREFTAKLLYGWREKKIQKREGKEIGQKLVSMEKFLGMRKLEGEAML